MLYAQYEEALAQLHAIGPDERKAFAAKLRFWRTKGIPKVERPGKGSMTDYTPDALWQTHFGLSLSDFGVAPAVVAMTVEFARQQQVRQRAADKARTAKCDAWLRLIVFGDFQCGIVNVLTLKEISADLKSLENEDGGAVLCCFINGSQLERDVLKFI